jgi:hypothetical protein
VDQSFRMATELNALARDLHYFVEQYRLSPDSGRRIFATGIAPRLEEAMTKFASCCEYEIIPRKQAQSERQREMALDQSESKAVPHSD